MLHVEKNVPNNRKTAKATCQNVQMAKKKKKNTKSAVGTQMFKCTENWNEKNWVSLSHVRKGAKCGQRTSKRKNKPSRENQHQAETEKNCINNI